MSKSFATQYDQYTTTSSGVTSKQPNNPIQNFALQVNADTGVTSWTVLLEGSLDGIKWDTIMTHTNLAPTGDGKVLWSGPNSYPCFYMRSRCTALDLGAGSKIAVTWLGVA